MPAARIPQPREWLLTKRCPSCGERKPWAKFSPRCCNPDGSVRLVVARCHECERKRLKLRVQRWERENRKRRNAYKNAWARRKRQQLREQGENGKAGGRLDVAPLRAFLLERSRSATFEELEAASGVDERVIRRLVDGRTRWVSLVQADRLITRLGGRLDDLYPLEQEAA